MIETLIQAGIAEGRSPVESFDFRTTVEIDGLPYIFKGLVPLVRKGYECGLYVPEMERFNTKGEFSRFFDDEAGEFGYRWFGCAGGYVRVNASDASTGFKLVELWSHAKLLSRRLPYYNATGIGNFLLHHVLAVADRLEEPIYLNPAPPTDGKLSMEAVVAWYERNGFQHLPPEEWQPSARMVRYPNPLPSQTPQL